MRIVFADAFFWIALIEPSDSWHDRVKKTFIDLQPCKLVTTDEVFSEVLTFYSNSGSYLRQRAISIVEDARKNPDVDVQPQSRQSAIEGEALYKQRFDKGYSLTDCISMNTMKRLNISEVLTHDKHFSQEGFTILFKEN